MAMQAVGTEIDLTVYGVAGTTVAILLWLLLQERAQRLKWEDRMIDLLSTLTPIVLNATRALEGYDRNVHETLRKIAELPDRADIDIAARRMEAATDALTKALDQMAARRRDTDG